MKCLQSPGSGMKMPAQASFVTGKSSLFEVMPTLAQRSEQLYAFHCSFVSLSVSFCRQNVYEINLRKEGFVLAHNVRYNVSRAGTVC